MSVGYGDDAARGEALVETTRGEQPAEQVAVEAGGEDIVAELWQQKIFFCGLSAYPHTWDFNVVVFEGAPSRVPGQVYLRGYCAPYSHFRKRFVISWCSLDHLLNFLHLCSPYQCPFMGRSVSRHAAYIRTVLHHVKSNAESICDVICRR